ncbi:ribose 5-phosphate isomerase B [candidate division KSB1 bacterium]|nr:ribose 5-phosphate isomerase B [candidate division KSB1 bacterium]
MKIIIGCDHAGYHLKIFLLKYLEKESIEVDDIGTDSDEAVDYPDYGYKVARSVAGGVYDRGILICGSGFVMSIVANKVIGIRAALVMSAEQAEMSKKHNDANILVFAGRMIDDNTAKDAMHRWLHAEFEGGRHSRRVHKIHDLAKMEN